MENIYWKTLDKNSIKDEYHVRELYEDAFVGRDRIPIKTLLNRCSRTGVQFISFYQHNSLQLNSNDDSYTELPDTKKYNKENFIGFAYLITDKKNTFFLYFATEPHLRSKGYGSKIMKIIKDEIVSGDNIFLNIEIVEKSAEDYEERLRRKDFYIRNGYIPNPFNIVDWGGTFETMVSTRVISKKEFWSLIYSYTGPFHFIPYFIETRLKQKVEQDAD